MRPCRLLGAGPLGEGRGPGAGAGSWVHQTASSLPLCSFLLAALALLPPGHKGAASLWASETSVHPVNTQDRSPSG